METSIIVNPNVGNFVNSIRDIGYSFEVAVADIIDNSITANSCNVKIHAIPEPELVFSLLDDGYGMSSEELIEAMRLATKNPMHKRDKNDLGRFGLGLKTASFSQCKKLTVVSKKDNIVSMKQWDLDYIANEDKWLLITPEEASIELLPLFQELINSESGTLIIWEEIDSFKKNGLSSQLDKLRKHLSLVFHRFLESNDSFNIYVNDNKIKAFNPFNINHPATQQLANEKIKINGSTTIIQPFILPHHSKLNQQEYEMYATEEGYTKSQGFYLYRANRLLIHGTWWGLHRINDVHKLVRIKIDISNDMDYFWGIDIKKSTANPMSEIKNDLKRIIRQVTEKGSRPYTGRGRKIEDKSTISFWEISSGSEGLRFSINRRHPFLNKLLFNLETENRRFLDLYLMGLEAYLPLDAIQAQLQLNPHKIKQDNAIDADVIKTILQEIKTSDLDPDYINNLLRSELFKNYKEWLANGTE
ncbi:hypothetical protein [Oceanobacillus iheyensis HTE831]|uniref:ATP-binding protein n=1 Tax=Oceanobacillus iheyensis (strain DSM 14371 / CIP 107618 / JCM 11309 / KCTC 3954 / HTE831) TaxID=221109 RepID=Q8ETT2_OCEIH|nr:ATP-binding protein [Oceanobacillus iheyensis]BAC12130.1 hypothetical protein [Oceanobacillus iheyensis HTE831]